VNVRRFAETDGIGLTSMRDAINRTVATDSRTPDVTRATVRPILRRRRLGLAAAAV
jgi:hypothetical protein